MLVRFIAVPSNLAHCFDESKYELAIRSPRLKGISRFFRTSISLFTELWEECLGGGSMVLDLLEVIEIAISSGYGGGYYYS